MNEIHRDQSRTSISSANHSFETQNFPRKCYFRKKQSINLSCPTKIRLLPMLDDCTEQYYFTSYIRMASEPPVDVTYRALSFPPFYLHVHCLLSEPNLRINFHFVRPHNRPPILNSINFILIISKCHFNTLCKTQSYLNRFAVVLFDWHKHFSKTATPIQTKFAGHMGTVKSSAYSE